MLLWLAVVAACGRIGFEAAPTCETSVECGAGSCVDGSCCNLPCDGTCNQCIAGICVPVPGACAGDCAVCEASGGGFSCAPEPAACSATCSLATCAGAGTTFQCETSRCCATSTAPNFIGSCGRAAEVYL